MTYATNQNIWFYAKFSLKDSTGATTELRCSNRPIVNDTTTYYPILKSISGVSAEMGAYLPLSQGGAIVLDNSPGSFGYERRFSDLFERLRIIDTEVVLYGAETAPDDSDVTADFEQLYKAKVRSWVLDVASDSLNIQIASAPLRKKVITRPVDSNSFPNAPTTSLGVHLPLVIGQDVEVKPLRIDADGDASPSYAYAVSVDNRHPVGGVQQYYAKNRSGEYQQVVSVSNVNTAFNTYTYTGSGIPWSCFAWAQRIDLGANDRYIATQIDINFKGTGSTGAYTEGLRISLATFGQDPASGPTEITGVNILKSNYRSQMQGSAEYTISAAFEHPAVLSADAMEYYVVVEQAVDAADIEWMIGVYNSTPQSVQRSYRYTATPGGVWVKPETVSTGNLLKFALYGVKITDSRSSAGNEEGLGVASFELTQKSAVTYYNNPDLTELDFIASIDGLEDDASGTVSGKPSSVISSPHHAIMLIDKIDKEYGGGGADPTRIESSAYSSTHAALSTSTKRYYRNVAGRTDGRTTIEQAMEAICRNACLRVGLINTATSGAFLGVYVWGTEGTSAATFTDENSALTTLEQRGTETIVNRISMYFDRRLRDIDSVTGDVWGQFYNYAKSINWTVGTNTIATALAEESQEVFGERPLADNSFDWLSDTTSAENVAAAFMSIYARPHTYVTVEVPMFRAFDLNVLDVITIVHPALSAYFGTSSLGKAPSYGGDAADPGLGHYLKRAKSYRAQVEGRQLNFNFGDVPTIRLVCRILDNYPADPT